MSKTRFIELTEGLCTMLKERRKNGLNELFGKGGIDRLRDCIIALKEAEDQGWNEEFHTIIMVQFSRFITLAGVQETLLKEEFSGTSLRTVMHLLKEISSLGDGGRLGTGGGSVIADIQKIIMRMRVTEEALATIDASRKL